MSSSSTKIQRKQENLLVTKGVERFRQATEGLGLGIVEQAQSTHTAEEAAESVGAPVGAIVKSLVFMTPQGPLLVLVSGPNRVNPERLGKELGTVLTKADATEVKEATGYSIGGVPPFGHPLTLVTVMDEDFFQFDELWAAAGSSAAVFPITPTALQELSHATVQRVT
jgi:prolyl-tRNA editing enzyme YbaK/EbsC (Cys-tRNA(Pro) deacylase)